jgi:hypothetical protein
MSTSELLSFIGPPALNQRAKSDSLISADSKLFAGFVSQTARGCLVAFELTLSDPQTFCEESSKLTFR